MSALEADADATGCCAICCFSAFEPWCNTKAYGGGGGNRLAGCCGSCCNKSFNEDSTDKWDQNRPTEKSQPGASEPMKIPAPTSKEPAPPAGDTTAPADHSQ
ncbi:hypothetical protein B0H19DRAFT_1153447 [Mycena capillaripes]|nr:hypothetical protein B0H19DRAFT_1153447 [Mycena capillaripes]